MAILKYLRVGDTAELQDNGVRWLRIPSQVATNKMSGVIYEDEDGQGIWTWWSNETTPVFYYNEGSEPANDTDGTAVAGTVATALLAAATVTDNALVRGAGGARGMEKTGILISDSSWDLVLPDGADLILQEEIQFVGATTENKIVLVDNLANALDVTEATNSYLKFTTTNSGEKVVFGKLFEAPTASKIGNLTLGDGSIVDSGGTIDFTTTNLTTGGDIKLDVDNAEIQFGVDGATDSYIRFDGTDLIFYDSNLAASYSLEDLLTGTQLNPSVTGDLSISNGNFDWNNNDNEAATWTFSNTAASDIDIDSVITSGECLHIIADDLTTGNVIHIDADSIGAAGSLMLLEITQAAHDNAGFFFSCHDHSANVFSVGEFGATIIKGVGGGTAVMTFTKGDLKLTDGVIDSDVDSAHGHNIATTQAGSATYPLVTITSSDGAHDQPLLKLDSASTTDINTLEIVNDGQGYGISIDDQKTDGSGLEILMKTASTANGIFIDANTGTYVGGTGKGMLHVHQSGTLAAADASAIFVNFDGAPAASGLGYCLLIDDDASAVATTYAVSVHSAANCPMKLETGGVTKNTLLLESTASQTASTLFIDGDTNDFTGANDVGLVHIDNDSAAQNAGSSLLILDFGGVGTSGAEGTCFRALDTGAAAAGTPYAGEIASTANNALQISTGAAGKTALTLKSAANTTAAVLKLDGDTNGWLGDTNTGMLHIDNDIALAQTTASLLLIDNATVKPKDAAKGYCLRVADASPVATGTNAYAAVIDSTANHGLEIITQATDMTGLTMTGKASATVSSVIVDGATGAYVGADDVGMLHLTHATTELAHIGSTLLRVQSSRQPKASAQGYLARFEGTGTVQAGAVAVEIAAKDSTEVALNCSAGIIKATEHRGIITDRQATDAGDGLAVCVSGETFIVADAFTADNGDILQLYAAVAGTVIWIYNDDATNDFVVEPFGNEEINGGGAGTGVTLGQLEYLRLVCMVDGLWIASEFDASGAMTTAA